MRSTSLIPMDGALALQRAAQTPNTDADPLARIKAIERAISTVRQAYPHLFREDGDETGCNQ